MPEHPAAKTVRGLNVAVIILSIVVVLASIAGIVFVALAANTVEYYNAEIDAYSTAVVDNLEITIDPDMDAQELQQYLDQIDEGAIVTGLAMVTAAVLYVCLALTIIFAIVSLIAGIMAYRNAGKKEKLGAPFVMAIVAAALALLSGRIITMVLLIISAVHINKIRKAVLIMPGTPQQ